MEPGRTHVMHRLGVLATMGGWGWESRPLLVVNKEICSVGVGAVGDILTQVSSEPTAGWKSGVSLGSWRGDACRAPVPSLLPAGVPW